jgi:hypothetical protein
MSKGLAGHQVEVKHPPIRPRAQSNERHGKMISTTNLSRVHAAMWHHWQLVAAGFETNI